MSRELLALGGWLAAQGVTHVGMESIGVFGKPSWKRHSKVGGTPQHRRLLQTLVAHRHFLEVQVEEMDTLIGEVARPFLRGSGEGSSRRPLSVGEIFRSMRHLSVAEAGQSSPKRSERGISTCSKGATRTDS